MSATAWYRSAAVILVLFAVAHTVGFLRFTPPTAEGIAVRDAMRTVTFPVGRSPFTYQGFYNGFGLFVTAYLLFSALLAWQLGGLARTQPQLITTVAWAFFATETATVVLSAMYFFTAPVVSSALVALCLGVAAFLTQRAAA